MSKEPTITHWQGRPIDELSREELIEAVKNIVELAHRAGWDREARYRKWLLSQKALNEFA